MTRQISDSRFQIDMRRRIIPLVAAILVAAHFAFSQNDGAEQNKTGRAGTFAIVNARIVTVSGAVIENGNVFDTLMDTVRVCSLGQITNALFDVGGQYRRSM